MWILLSLLVFCFYLAAEGDPDYPVILISRKDLMALIFLLEMEDECEPFAK